MLLMGRVLIQEPANHFLVLSIIFFRFFFKKIHTRFAKSNGDLNENVGLRTAAWGRAKLCY